MRIILLMTLLVGALFGGEVKWNDSFEAAKAKALKDNKILYVVITSETCKWCRKLENETLSQKSVIDNLNSSYSAVALTRGKDSYPPCLKAPMVPMSYFLTPAGTVIYSVPGYWSEEDYLSMMGDVERKFKKQQMVQGTSNK